LSTSNNAFRPESTLVETGNDTGLVDLARSGLSLDITDSVASYVCQLALGTFDVREKKGSQQGEVEKKRFLSVTDRAVGFGHERACAPGSVGNVGECG